MELKINIEFKPHKKGIRQVLGELEADIMEYIWEHGACTVKQVHNYLNDERELAYTTVMTVMSRLAEKSLLRREQVGNAYRYHATVSREQFAQQIVGEVLDSLLGSFGEETISHFANRIGQVEEDRLLELEKAIRRKRGE
ncbi:MAG: BlaI/MecI/CopY family transcriptional regulator [Firmicutes bacterium]|nr:BlaI/MecI/CopY family transcriptional regulator [Bacillota bacterium]